MGVSDVLDILEREVPKLEENLRSFEGKKNKEELGVTIVFGFVGENIVKNIKYITRPHFVFGEIEKALASESHEIKAAICTGLIEAMIHESDRVPGSWEAIYPLLGPRSRAYADAWMDFTKGQ